MAVDETRTATASQRAGPAGPVPPAADPAPPAERPSPSPLSFFSFPHPVNETSARVVAGGVVTMVVATVALDQPWLMVPLTYGFAARVLTGPRLSPLGLLATRVVTPRLRVRHRYSPGPPKRLAQGVGLTLSGTALLLHFRFGRTRLAYCVLAALGTAAALESLAGVCLACKAFPTLMRVGLVPAHTCEKCVGPAAGPEEAAATAPAAVKPAT
ncbi:MAG TPA: DUF4395 domain-containing protein [Acidimicrobiales bacterium]|nr:DUF4395 domain-containing protein [Acidimicrobiales bacterium]